MKKRGVMAKSDLIVAVDIGSGKMTAVVAAQNVETNMLEVLAGKSIPCSGIRGGIVCDITETAAAIEALVLSLARDCDEKSFDQLFIGLRGSHLESFASHGTYNISRPDKEISENDMELAKENAKAVAIKNNYEIVNIIEQEYTINKQRGIRNPEGMEASLLEVDVQIVTGATAHLRNLTKAIQRKFHIEGSVYGLIALGMRCYRVTKKKTAPC